MKKKVTIVIPIYNASSHLEKCVESVINQTYQNLEIILVDDGSTDNSGTMCDDFASKDKRIKVIHKDNGGVSSARNYGINISSGDYICFLDSDDYYNHNFVNEMYHEIVKKNADLCYCGYIKVDNGNMKRNKTKFTTKNCLLNYFSGKTKIQTGCFFIKKDLIIDYNLKFEEGVSWGEDYKFFSSIIFYAKRVSYLNNYYLFYNVTDNDNKLSKVNVAMIEKDKKMILDIISDLKLSERDKNMLLYYRLPALLINKIYLLKGKNDLRNLFRENINYINNLKFNNGLRSLKLYFKKYRLEKFL